MKKGYWIAHIDVADLDAYRAYVAASTEAVKHHGGRFLIRGGQSEQVEGAARSRHAVIEFDSYEQAQKAYRSSQYQAARALRLPCSTADIAVVEGWEG